MAKRAASPLVILFLLAVQSLGAGCETSLTGIEIGPVTQLPKGTSVQLTALGRYSDGTQQDLTAQLTWTSDNPAAVTVADAPDRKGRITAVGRGRAQISGRFGEQSAAVAIQVSDALIVAIAITPPSPVIARGTQVQLTAIATLSDGTIQDVTAAADWSSSAPPVAELRGAGASGLVTAAAPGTATIRAALAEHAGSVMLRVKDATLTSLAVFPVNPILASGSQQPLTAIGTFSDQSTQDLSGLVDWSSSDDRIVTVSGSAGARGVCTALNKGTAILTATFAGVSGTAVVTVTDATLVAIGITPPAAVIARGTTQQFTATGTYSDGTTQDITTAVVWSAGSDRVASISNLAGAAGLSSARASGSSTIVATLSGKTGLASLVVSAEALVAVTVSSPSPAIAQGTMQQFVATGVYADGSSQDLSDDVTWDSSDPAVLAVSNASGSRGLATGLAKGTVTVTAVFGLMSGSVSFAVSDAILSALTLAPSSATLASGTTTQLAAIGIYSDGMTQDLTSQVSWAISDKLVGQISNAPGSQGLLTALSKGAAALSATLAGVTGSGALMVTDATLMSLLITPKSTTLLRGAEQQFVAIGKFSDGTTQDVTAAATWSSSTPAVATISNAADSKGLATSLTVGPTIIVASLNGKVDSTTLTVN